MVSKPLVRLSAVGQYCRRKRLFFLIVLPVMVLVLAMALPAWSDETKTLQEQQHEQANQLREQSKARAQSGLSYPNVEPVDGQSRNNRYTRAADYYALSEQIKRLAAILQRLNNRERVESLTGLSATGPLPVNMVYGPDGPTEKTVRILLEYRLMVTGNPRLKVGKVIDNGEKIIAHIVTTDGSLVEEYSIDKKDGVISPVR